MADATPFPSALTEGYRAFLDDRFVREQDRYASLAEGQSPEILIISCCDSRVSPEVIFDARPGELFVVRNVANLVPPFETGGEYHGTSAALEFAVQALKVKHIVVLGHARCGGVRAYADDAAPLSPGDFIGRWVSLIRPAAEALGDEPRGPDYLEQLEYATVTNSLRNLMTFPCVRILVERGKLQLHGAHFGIATGQLRIRDPETGEFRLAEPDRAAHPTRLIRCQDEAGSGG
ncbi:carbonate dehydratase [Methylobacterium tarhaniae]|uniref:Carbonic anhydrase n=1 Tax=Methylobacterium tarhaniae TaxID=1187852 RepID=A0A0J6SWT1_9HYPH|nr:carbonic anhydrase [Methylobacterium tarhaniae]KMO39705.1 carbonate dehydratase [Methylobacterium tarhaniae]